MDPAHPSVAFVGLDGGSETSAHATRAGTRAVKPAVGCAPVLETPQLQGVSCGLYHRGCRRRRHNVGAAAWLVWHRNDSIPSHVVQRAARGLRRRGGRDPKACAICTEACTKTIQTIYKTRDGAM